MAKNNKYWDDRALRRLSDAEKIGDDYIKRVKDIYKKAFRDIEKDIQDVYINYSKDTGLDIQKLKTLLSAKETDKVWKDLKRRGLDKYIKNNYKARISRLEKMQAQIYAKAKQIYPKEELQQEMCYKGVINDSYYKAVYDTQMATGHNFSFSKIDESLEKSLLSERWSGKNFSEIIWGNTDILADNVADIVGSGLLNGKSVSRMTKDLRERFKVGQYYAERLIRTETNYFHNQADAMAYEEMGVDKYVFVATLDNRTSEICQSMDGKKFDYKDKEVGVNYPPLHPNCRSKTRGYVDEEVEKTLKRRARNPITGKNEIIDNMTYKEWLEKQKVTYGDKAISDAFKKKKKKKPKTIRAKHTTIKKQIGFYDNGGMLTFIPKNTTITNTRVIAGDKVATKFRNAQKYADTYGGNKENYSKIAGKIDSAKYTFDVHFVVDDKGNEYDFKIKNKTLKEDKHDR